jgi:hypothetical protein
MPWKLQHGFNNQQPGGIVGWTVSPTNLPVGITEAKAFITKQRAYIMGGIVDPNGQTRSNAVYTAPIDTNGNLGTWTTSTPLPVIMSNTHLIVTNQRVFLMGGDIDGGGSSRVYTASINADGTLGAWTIAPYLPTNLYAAGVIVTNQRVFLLGGITNSLFSAVVYTAPINTDGTLGAWTTAAPLPAAMYGAEVIVTGSSQGTQRVHLLGGGYGPASYSSIIRSAPINPDGTLGAWVTDTPLPSPRGRGQVVTTRQRVFYIGGGVGPATNTVFSAPINADGTLGAWAENEQLPTISANAQIIITSQKIYHLGGGDNSASNAIFVAPFAGGSNDYSPYYDGSPNGAPLGQFTLPMLEQNNVPGSVFYIKT